MVFWWKIWDKVTCNFWYLFPLQPTEVSRLIFGKGYIVVIVNYGLETFKKEAFKICYKLQADKFYSHDKKGT